MHQHELNPTAPTWDTLVHAEPSLKEFERSAREAGQNHFTGWLGWVIHHAAYVTLFDARCCPPLLATHVAWRTALDHLADCYHEGQRQAQRDAQRARLPRVP